MREISQSLTDCRVFIILHQMLCWSSSSLNMSRVDGDLWFLHCPCRGILSLLQKKDSFPIPSTAVLYWLSGSLWFLKTPSSKDKRIYSKYVSQQSDILVWCVIQKERGEDIVEELWVVLAGSLKEKNQINSYGLCIKWWNCEWIAALSLTLYLTVWSGFGKTAVRYLDLIHFPLPARPICHIPDNGNQGCGAARLLRGSGSGSKF